MSEFEEVFIGLVDSELGPGEDLGQVRLLDLDSLLVTEMLVIVEEAVGRAVEIETFDPSITTVRDLARFCSSNGRPSID